MLESIRRSGTSVLEVVSLGAVVGGVAGWSWQAALVVGGVFGLVVSRQVVVKREAS
jgi:ABC-type uncharacterized transport system permease subunit